MNQALLNIPYPLFDAATATASISDPVAIPARCTTITWQSFFTVDPDAISIGLEVSLDGTNWDSIDVSTAVGGEVRTVETNVTHARAQINSITNGTGVTVLINCKDL